MKMPIAAIGPVVAALVLVASAEAASSKAPVKAPPKKVSAPKSPAVGEYATFPAVGVKLRKPAGMVESKTWTGFEADASRASLMIVKIAGPFAEISSGFTAENMAPRGMKLVSKVAREVDGQPGVLVFFTMSAGGTDWDKWSLVFGDATRTHMITGTFPTDQRKRLTEPVKASLLSTRLEAGGNPEDDLTFTLTASPKLKPTSAISGSLCYTRDGAIPAKSPEDPFFIAAPSLSKSPVPAPRRFSEQRLRETEQTRVTAVTSHEPITIDDLEGYESLAEATDAKSGTPIVVYQVMLFEEGRYYMLQGQVGARLKDEYLPEFKTMVRSFKRKPQRASK